MRKYVFLIILILSLFNLPVYSQEEMTYSATPKVISEQEVIPESDENSYQEVSEEQTQENSENGEVSENGEASNNPPYVVSEPEDIIFQTDANQMIQMMDGGFEMYDGEIRSFGERFDISDTDYSRMPVFKQLRLKSTFKYREHTARDDSKMNFSRLLFWKKDSNIPQDGVNEIPAANVFEKSESDLSATIDNVANIESSDTVSFETGISEEKVEKQLLLDAVNINYDNETGEMVATGRPILFLPPQKTKIIADVMTYDDQGNILKATGNVIVIKDGKPTHTDYLVVNLNEETIEAENIFAEFPRLNITSEHGLQQDGLLIFTKGTMYSEEEGIYRLKSQMVGPNIQDMILAEGQEALFFGTPEHSIDIKVSKLEIDARKNHDIIKAKDIRIGHNEKYFFKWPSMTIYTNKERDYFDGNYPEFGTQRKIGMFAGPGVVFSGPFGSVMKVIPMVTYNKKFGIGGMVRYTNTFNRTEFGYSTVKNMFVLRGRQQLDDDLYLQYGYNTYVNEWFYGARMPKYIAELVYNKSFVHPNFLGDGRTMTFSHRASFGFVKDDDENSNGEKFRNNTNFSTTRTKYMAMINQNLFRYENLEQRFRVTAGLTLQGSGTLYGSGDTQFIARGGPSLRIQYKNWIQNATYFISGYQDGTPMPHFDAYRYGTSSVRLSEAFRICKYVTVAWQTYVNLSDDAPNKKTFQENAFLVSLGPDDFKVVLGYDFIRERTYFGFNIAFNPKGTTVRYDKMIIKNPEKLGKSPREEDKVAYVPANNYEDDNEEQNGLVYFKKSAPAKVLEYATVIELEDPEKERIE